MAQFILEIGIEEMPARFLTDLESNMSRLCSEKLKDQDINYGKINLFSSPRRLAVWIDQIFLKQEERQEIINGPPFNMAYTEDGQLTKAGQGFIRSQGVETNQVFIRDTEKGKYLAVQKMVGGEETISLLPEICSQIIHQLPFSKKMRWNSSGFEFGRPIRWIMALLDKEVVPIKVANLTADRWTWGHRVMGQGPWKVDQADNYFQVIEEKGRVVLDRKKRRDIIVDLGQRLAQEKGGSVIWSQGLLQEAASLVEYPKPVLGRISSKYLELPREVLLSSMEGHQKSFGVEDKEGQLLPYFLCTLNLEPKDLDLVRRGWERVLKARLEDAAFFWKTDTKASLEDWLEELYKVVFLGPLGNMGQKTERLTELSSFLSQERDLTKQEDFLRAAKLAKVDLVSEMVGEFDNLQGIMGSIYARQKGEKETVSRAIYEQYLPTGPDSPVPSTLGGAILSVADKIDNLTGCFGLNMVPSGTQDPYALRRQALGVVRITLEHNLRYKLDELLEKSFDIYGLVDWKLSRQETVEALKDFFAHRIRAYYTGQGYGTLIVEASLKAGMNNLCTLDLRLKALNDFSKKEDYEQAVLTFKRVDNIIRKQGDKAPKPLDGHYQQDKLVEVQEKELADKIEEMDQRWEQMWAEENFDQLLALLRELRPFVDNFFNQVMVITDEDNLRQNRLNLLQKLVNRLSPLADFSALQI